MITSYIKTARLGSLALVFCGALFLISSCTNDTSDSENDFEVLNPSDEEGVYDENTLADEQD